MREAVTAGPTTGMCVLLIGGGSRRRSARQALDVAREGWVMTPRLFKAEVWTFLDEISLN